MRPFTSEHATNESSLSRSPRPALPCPCGRDQSLVECCLPVAQRLRRGAGGRPSPFDEIRATSALMLWGLLSREEPGSAVLSALSAAAQRFWCSVLSAASGGATPLGASGDSPWRAPGLSGLTPDTLGPPVLEQDLAYGRCLFERVWAAADAETVTWLLAALPQYVRDDPVLGELALDWLLWDEPWLRGAPAASWTARSDALAARPRLRHTYASILDSRVGLWRLEEHLPGRAFRLVDRLTGDRTTVHTSSPPWPEPEERALLARTYSFGRWRLLGGRCLLLAPDAVDCLLADLAERAASSSAPKPADPRWRGWLAPQLLPLTARHWAARRLPAMPTKAETAGASSSGSPTALS